jgi:hypothetical protein
MKRNSISILMVMTYSLQGMENPQAKDSVCVRSLKKLSARKVAQYCSKGTMSFDTASKKLPTELIPFIMPNLNNIDIDLKKRLRKNCLTLSHLKLCSLEGVDNPSFCDAIKDKVQTLDISGNNLTSVDFAQLKQAFPYLRKINADRNCFTTLSWDDIEKAKTHNLSLSLKNNKIGQLTGKPTRALDYCRYGWVNRLDLRNNPLSQKKKLQLW